MEEATDRSSPGRRWAILVAALVAILVGAGIVAFVASRTDDDIPLDASDPHAWLTMRFWAYSIADYWQPSDLPNVAVYPDGTVLRTRLEPTGDDGDARLVAERMPIPRATLDELYRQVVEAGLTGGGVQPMVQLPNPGSVVDGGRTAFTSTIEGVTTTRVLDQGGFGVDGDAERQRFEALQSALTPFLASTSPGLVEVPITSWALLSEPAGDRAPIEGQAWTGPDLDTLAWTTVDGVECAIVERDDWALSVGERQMPWLVVDGRVVTRRPLLPGTTSCADVVATTIALEPARMQRATEPG